MKRTTIYLPDELKAALERGDETLAERVDEALARGFGA
jgi:hypothetical protein